MSHPQFGGLPDQQQAAPVTVQPEYDAAALADHAPERVDDGGQSAGAMPAGVAFQAAAAPAAAISNGNNSTSSATREIVIRLPPRYEAIHEKLICFVWHTLGLGQVDLQFESFKGIGIYIFFDNLVIYQSDEGVPEGTVEMRRQT